MILCFLFAALIVALDQFFKQWVVRAIDIGATGPEIIPGVLGLTHWENDGAMLNILSGQQWLLAGIALVAAVALVMILLRYNEGFWGTIGLTAVLGGTVGNLCDRVFNDGKVIDMFRTLFINFPIFNIADIFITLGFITFLVHFIVLTFKVGKSEDTAAARKPKVDPEQYMAENPSSINVTDIDLPEVAAVVTGTHDDAMQQPVMSAPPATMPVMPSEPAAAAPVAPVAPVPVAAPVTPVAAPIAPVADYIAPAAPVAAPIASATPIAPAAPVTPVTPIAAPIEEDYSAYDDDIDPTTDTTPEISFTMEALEAELGSLDVPDYDVDELLREYGLEDDDFDV